MPAPKKQVLILEARYPEHRVCYHCNELKPLGLFYGTGRKKKTRECKKCRAKRNARADSPYRISNLVNMARDRARRFALPFDLTPKDIVIPKVCPVFGIQLRWGKGTQRDHSPSIDRIEPSLGYVTTNIIIVSWLANNIRSKFSPDQLRTVADFYEALLSTRTSAR